MVYVVWRRRTTPFHGLIYLFGAFIFFCGLTHLLDTVTAFHPVYRLEGLVKLATAGVSWAAVVTLVRTTPEALVLRSPAELEAEIAARERAAREREELLRMVETERARLQAVLEQLPSGVILVDAVTRRVIQANEAARQVIGDLWPGAEIAEAYERPAYYPDGRRYALEERPMSRVLRSGDTIRGEELRFDRPGHSPAILEVNAGPIRDAEGRLTAGVVVFQDTTALRQAEEQREADARRIEGILDSITDSFCALDREWRFTHVNPQAEAYLGRSAEELVGRVVWEAFPNARGTVFEREYRRALAEGVPVQFETASAARPGRTIEVRGFPSPEGLSVFFRDVTERKQAEEERERLLAEQGRLAEHLKLSVQEAHHRIKNNLQAVTDLLSLELNSAAEPETRRVLEQTISRVRSIALVHDLLSHEDEPDTVDAKEVGERLVPMVLYGNLRSPVQVALKMEFEAVRLSSRAATTVALALNELVSNAAKHALAGREAGRLHAGLQREGERACLWVHDDGPGLPAEFNPSGSRSVGLRVLRALVRTNLNGVLTLENRNGLRAAIEFPPSGAEPENDYAPSLNP